MHPTQVAVILVDLYFVYLIFTLDKADPTLPAIVTYMQFKALYKIFRFLL